MDRGAWQATVHRDAQSWTQLKQLLTAQHSTEIYRTRLLSCCCSVAKSCLTLRSLDCSKLGSPVLHYLPAFALIHVH